MQTANARPRPGWKGAALARVEEAVSTLMSATRADAARLVLVLPPFASPDRPSLGLHVLARVAEARNWPVDVVYANLSFAQVIGPQLYRVLCHTPTGQLTGERVFRAAYPQAAFGNGTVPEGWAELPERLTPDFRDLQAVACVWADAMAAALAGLKAPVIGMSTVFEQTMPSLALIHRIKAQAPDKLTLIGGANVDDEMGEGMADYAPEVDHIFQGEAETSLDTFLVGLDRGEDQPRVLPGRVNVSLDDLACPDYSTFFRQFDATVHRDACPNGLDRDELRLPYESSRGCWWGAKHHCTFCGLNANGMTHRIKSPEKVRTEIQSLARSYGLNRILMVDNIMPHSYVSTLLPALAKAEQRLEIFYEQKANLSLNRMALLEAAGVTSIQPGIESLSTGLLRRMRKGSTLQTNLDCLRFARAAGVETVWNLLTDFPGDQADDYEGMIRIIPALHHLQPPGGVGGLSIDRFSPYHTDPDAFGIASIAPLDAYAEVFAGISDDRLAYHFTGDYPSAIRTDPDLHARLTAVVDDWLEAWKSDTPPLVFVFDLGLDRHLLVDTRAVAANPSRLIDTAEAHVLLTGASELTPVVRRALDDQTLIAADGRYLAVASAALTSRAWARERIAAV